MMGECGGLWGSLGLNDALSTRYELDGAKMAVNISIKLDYCSNKIKNCQENIILKNEKHSPKPPKTRCLMTICACFSPPYALEEKGSSMHNARLATPHPKVTGSGG